MSQQSPPTTRRRAGSPLGRVPEENRPHGDQSVTVLARAHRNRSSANALGSIADGAVVPKYYSGTKIGWASAVIYRDSASARRDRAPYCSIVFEEGERHMERALASCDPDRASE